MDSLPNPHSLPAADVAAGLGVDTAAGLRSEEAAERLRAVGRNELEPPRRTSPAALLVDAATEPFVLLLAAAGVAAVLLGEVRDGLLVLVALIPIVGADVITEYRGERALDALKAASAAIARVRRDGRAQDVPAAALVPGDVVLLRVGDVVPADVRVVRTERLLLDRSALTGESVPELASIEPDPEAAPLADRRSIAYAGTSVVGGRGEGIVVATGRSTEVGRIAGALDAPTQRRSPLQRELDRLVRILLVVAIGLIAIVTTLGFLRGRPAGENVLAGITAAIAAIPEEPPVLLAVVLGLGAYRLLRRGVLVRRLNAEEALGAVDLILTDKTGTLTENRLVVMSVATLDGSPDPDERASLVADALRAEDDAWQGPDGVPPGSFTRALASTAAVSLRAEDILESSPPSDGRPFSSTRARDPDGVVRERALGAPERVLALAGDAGPWRRALDEMTARGERVVALAVRSDSAPWQARALIGFADRIRPGIPDAIAAARRAGIQVVVVTGDHPATAVAIARECGIEDGLVVTGEQLAGWDDERVRAELPRLSIVARSTPDQKERLVAIARASRRMVAVTGDGVNDAPALHRADVAVAMGSGTAVAREAADLVLTDDSFATLMYGLMEGRRIVDNIRKGLVFLVSTHVALLGFVLIATLAGFSQPLLPLQVLWLELFIDLSTSIAFEREPPEPDLATRPPRRVAEPLLDAGLLARITAAGSFSAVAALVVMVAHGGPPGHARWLAYSALVCSQAVRAYLNRSLRTPVHRLVPNRLLLFMAVLVIAVQAAIPYVPPLADAFQATPLDAVDWAIVAVIALTPAVLAELVRSIRRTEWVA